MMENVRFLGDGSFGSVDLVRFKQKDGTFKLYARKTSKTGAYANLSKELRVLSRLKGRPGVIQCESESLTETSDSNGEKMFSMLMEYANGGTLETLMENQQGRVLPDHKIRQFAKMILRGIKSIHKKKYIHCDLKPENILVFNRIVENDGVWSTINEVKIADFGTTMEPEKNRKDWWVPSSPFIGTPLYMSPESVQSGNVGRYLDIWSFGCILLEMYTGKSPWPNRTYEEVKAALSNGKTPEIPENLPLFAKRLLEICFELNPKQRLSASKLLKHPFFQEGLDEPERCATIGNNVVKETKKGREKQHFQVEIISPKQPSPVKNKVLTFKYIGPKPKIVKLRFRLGGVGV